MSKQLLRCKDVAEMFAVSEDRVYTLARQKIIPTVRVGRTLRFSIDAINAFIDEGGRAVPESRKSDAV